MELSYECHKCGAENRNVTLSEFGLHFNFISNNKYDYEEVHNCCKCGEENRFKIIGEADNSKSISPIFSFQAELKTRLNKLEAFIKGEYFNKLEKEARESLFWQRKYMYDCIEILENHIGKSS